MDTKDLRTIIHLELNGRHEYYGSPSSLYDKHDAEELGIGQSALNNYFCRLTDDEEQIYSNKLCVIRKGKLYVKQSSRGRKKLNENDSFFNGKAK